MRAGKIGTYILLGLAFVSACRQNPSSEEIYGKGGYFVADNDNCRAWIFSVEDSKTGARESEFRVEECEYKIPDGRRIKTIGRTDAISVKGDVSHDLYGFSYYDIGKRNMQVKGQQLGVPSEVEGYPSATAEEMGEFLDYHKDALARIMKPGNLTDPPSKEVIRFSFQ